MPGHSSFICIATVDLTAREEIERLLAYSFRESPERLAHILRVARFTEEVLKSLPASVLAPSAHDQILRASLLHDIGYLPELKHYLSEHTPYEVTGWHPIDGANYLRHRKEPLLAELIEGHSNSLEVTELRGFPPFTPSEQLGAKIITYCDVQTGPTGEPIDYHQRLEEIRNRKGEDSISYRAHKNAKHRIEAILGEINALRETS
ncbi:HD domain-containing protein [bacterium]|nr:HD domain-containing protein [bacterium]